jgi:hypothetical protein
MDRRGRNDRAGLMASNKESPSGLTDFEGDFLFAFAENYKVFRKSIGKSPKNTAFLRKKHKRTADFSSKALYFFDVLCYHIR